MASKGATANGSKAPRTNSSQAADAGQTSVRSAVREDEIRLRAYEIYLQRGEDPGGEVDDWLQAEGELENMMHSNARKA